MWVLFLMIQNQLVYYQTITINNIHTYNFSPLFSNVIYHENSDH